MGEELGPQRGFCSCPLSFSRERAGVRGSEWFDGIISLWRLSPKKTVKKAATKPTSEIAEVLAAVKDLSRFTYSFAKSVDKRFGVVDKRFDAVDKRFEQGDKRFESIDRKFEIVFDNFKVLRKDMDELKQEMKVVHTRLDRIDEDNELPRAYAPGILATASGLSQTALLFDPHLLHPVLQYTSV